MKPEAFSGAYCDSYNEINTCYMKWVTVITFAINASFNIKAAAAASEPNLLSYIDTRKARRSQRFT